ncbi:universal stress protein [Streptomyces sp. NPDC097704]|uniref:universal stress protein n=1 Tax=Streptomyces sp. NPDC097704 TaxID=3157101 RepID=UPI00332598E4
MNTTDTNSHVVVGVDGSPSSCEALRRAVRHARLIGATVDVIAAHDVPGAVRESAPPVAAALTRKRPAAPCRTRSGPCSLRSVMRFRSRST